MYNFYTKAILPWLQGRCMSLCVEGLFNYDPYLTLDNADTVNIQK